MPYQAEPTDLNDPSCVSAYSDSGWVTIEGVVDAYPDARHRWTYLQLAAEWSVAERKKARPPLGGTGPWHAPSQPG